MNIVDTIRSRYYGFSPAEQKVASYVLGNYEKIQFMSISELAELSEVADATVTRFCRSLDLKGFNVFKIELAKCVAKGHTSAHVNAEEDVLSSGQQSASESKAAIDETIALLDKDAIHRAVSLFEEADRVMCAGSGGSMRIADECAHLFSIVDPKFIAVSDSHSQVSTVANMKENDVVLLISYSGATVNGIELLDEAKL